MRVSFPFLLVASLALACTETPDLPPCIDNTPCPGLDASVDGSDAASDANVHVDAGDGATSRGD